MKRIYLPNKYLENFDLIYGKDNDITLKSLTEKKDIRYYTIIGKDRGGIIVTPKESKGSNDDTK